MRNVWLKIKKSFEFECNIILLKKVWLKFCQNIAEKYIFPKEWGSNKGKIYK